MAKIIQLDTRRPDDRMQESILEGNRNALNQIEQLEAENARLRKITRRPLLIRIIRAITELVG